MSHSDKNFLYDSSSFWERLASNSRKTDIEACGGSKYLFENRFKFHEDDLILDAGCGYGRFSIPLASRCKRVVAIDLSESMLKRLKRNCTIFRLNNIDIIRADLRFLPFRPECFDKVICWSTIYYIPRRYWRSIIKGFSNVLTKKGELIIQFKSIFAMLSRRYLFGFLYFLSHIVVYLSYKIGFFAELLHKLAFAGRVEFLVQKHSLQNMLNDLFSEIRIKESRLYIECHCKK